MSIEAISTSVHLRVPAHVHWRRFDAELVIVDLRKGQYYGLSEVAALAFEQLASGQSAEAVVATILDVYTVSQSELQADITHLLDEFVRLELGRIERD